MVYVLLGGAVAFEEADWEAFVEDDFESVGVPVFALVDYVADLRGLRVESIEVLDYIIKCLVIPGVGVI